MSSIIGTSAYPISVVIQIRLERRNRLTTAFRPILAIPHSILVGPIYWSSRTAGVGLLGAVAYFLAIVSWFSLLLTGDCPHGIREFCLYYLRWRTRALAYMALFVDEYPPFDDNRTYPAWIDVLAPTVPRNRVSIAFRFFLTIPHLIALCFLLIAWFVTTVVAWLAILFTGSYPSKMHSFGVSVMRWVLRVEGYLLLLVDEYPPFLLE